MPRGGITVYLPRELEARIRVMARDQRRSESSVVADAVKSRFAQNGGEANGASPRAQARIALRLDKLIGESLLIKEIALLFVRLWLEHNPPLDADLAESAAASAEARFADFLDVVAQAVGTGSSLAYSMPARSDAEEAIETNGEARP
ncbi:MAG TPA: hypothetical protein DHW63_09260 [Hyphomonadaceae bacterium]|nr:hypothetical protein [Hyphomonadaceae bacterium]